MWTMDTRPPGPNRETSRSRLPSSLVVSARYECRAPRTRTSRPIRLKGAYTRAPVRLCRRGKCAAQAPDPQIMVPVDKLHPLCSWSVSGAGDRHAQGYGSRPMDSHRGCPSRDQTEPGRATIRASRLPSGLKNEFRRIYIRNAKVAPRCRARIAVKED
jgi:hypothetical protein